MTAVLLPWYVDPWRDPLRWRIGAATATPAVVVDAAHRSTELPKLASAGAVVLGRVDTAFAARPIADLLAEVARWAGSAVAGVFLDRAPTSAFSLGAVALAIRVARRHGLTTVVLNPGVPTDPGYRQLGAAICTFEGPWVAYRRWSGHGCQPGDGQLVHSVPTGELPAAWDLLRRRGAGWGAVTDRIPPEPGDGVGSEDTSRKTGW